MRRYFEDNEIIFPKTFVKNLLGKETDAITAEYIPTNQDIAKFIEFLPLIGRSIVLVLSSSGMRIARANSVFSRPSPIIELN